MSRLNTGAPIIVKPSNNIYTALSGVAVLISLAAVVVVYLAYVRFDFNLFAM